jgi:hypothetical protein
MPEAQLDLFQDLQFQYLSSRSHGHAPDDAQALTAGAKEFRAIAVCACYLSCMSGRKHDGDDQRRPSDEYSDEEAIRRRDAVVKRMLDTPPQPRKGAAQKPKGRRVKSRL